MGYEDVISRVSELDRMVAEGASARVRRPSAEPGFARLLDAQLQSQQQPQPAAQPMALAQLPQGAAPAGLPVGMLPPSPALMYQLAAGGGYGATGALAAAAPAAPPVPAAPTMVHGDMKGLDPGLTQALERVARDIGKPIEVISGLRTHAEQAALYQKYLNGTGNLAARPGTSRHESGDAADVYVDGVALQNVPGAADAARRAGLGFPVPGEPWHIEPVGGHSH